MIPWIEKNEKELKSLYYKPHTSLSGMTSIPSKAISLKDWLEYAESFKNTHPVFINLNENKMIAKSEKHRIVPIVEQNATTYQIQVKHKLFGWIKKRIVFVFLNTNFKNPNNALEFYNILELKK